MGRMHAQRSDADNSSHCSILRAISIRFAWVTGTRFVTPVVPDVLKIAATDVSVNEVGRESLAYGLSGGSSLTAASEPPALDTLKVAPKHLAQGGVSSQFGIMSACGRVLPNSASI